MLSRPQGIDPFERTLSQKIFRPVYQRESQRPADGHYMHKSSVTDIFQRKTPADAKQKKNFVDQVSHKICKTLKQQEYVHRFYGKVADYQGTVGKLVSAYKNISKDRSLQKHYESSSDVKPKPACSPPDNEPPAKRPVTKPAQQQQVKLRTKGEQMMRQLKSMSRDIEVERRDQNKSQHKKEIVKYPVDFKTGEKKTVDTPLYRSTNTVDFTRLKANGKVAKYSELDVDQVLEDLVSFNMGQHLQQCREEVSHERMLQCQKIRRLQKRKQQLLKQDTNNSEFSSRPLRVLDDRVSIKTKQVLREFVGNIQRKLKSQDHPFFENPKKPKRTEFYEVVRQVKKDTENQQEVEKILDQIKSRQNSRVRAMMEREKIPQKIIQGKISKESLETLMTLNQDLQEMSLTPQLDSLLKRQSVAHMDKWLTRY